MLAPKRQLLDLPFELIVSILRKLDARSLLRCCSVSHALNALIASSTELQYLIELALDGMHDGPPSTLSTADRLARLRQLRAAWAALALPPAVSVPMPGPCQAYELVAGVFAKTTTTTRTAPFATQFLATALPGVADPGWSLERDDLGVPTRDFAIDPSQDLIALVQLDRDDPPFVAQFMPPGDLRIHLRTLSTNAPHSGARVPVLHCAVPFPITGAFIQIVDDVVGMLFWAEPDGPRIILWNWVTGREIVDQTNSQLPPGTWDFSFLSSRAYMLTCATGHGSIEIFTFSGGEDESQPPSNSAPKSSPPPLVHVASLKMPPLQPDVHLVNFQTHTGPFVARGCVPAGVRAAFAASSPSSSSTSASPSNAASSTPSVASSTAPSASSSTTPSVPSSAPSASSSTPPSPTPPFTPSNTHRIHVVSTQYMRVGPAGMLDEGLGLGFGAFGVGGLGGVLGGGALGGVLGGGALGGVLGGGAGVAGGPGGAGGGGLGAGGGNLGAGAGGNLGGGAGGNLAAGVAGWANAGLTGVRPRFCLYVKGETLVGYVEEYWRRAAAGGGGGGVGASEREDEGGDSEEEGGDSKEEGGDSEVAWGPFEDLRWYSDDEEPDENEPDENEPGENEPGEDEPSHDEDDQNHHSPDPDHSAVHSPSHEIDSPSHEIDSTEGSIEDSTDRNSDSNSDSKNEEHENSEKSEHEHRPFPPLQVPWAQWGVLGTRMLHQQVAFQWLRYVHGQRVVVPVLHERGQVMQVLDFNVCNTVRQVRAFASVSSPYPDSGPGSPSPPSPGSQSQAHGQVQTQLQSQAQLQPQVQPQVQPQAQVQTQIQTHTTPSLIPPAHIFASAVVTALPYRVARRDAELGAYAGMMIDGERLVGVKYPAFSDGDMKHVHVFAL
ncbi:hypothetical protein BV22DRAFT_1194726 [Leucogyrophana mollusca]|uniref:Uncharacterized protein n=1 Tax=Leucogyrophana mollusca TaxID=85980 RepID=A0ACB8BKE0_9AGAM|nr:hypothetical protein BV22DRAFT_1194726 [Leucogyrophana mollusca]